MTLRWTSEEEANENNCGNVCTSAKIAFEEFNHVKSFDDLVLEDIDVEEGVETILEN